MSDFHDVIFGRLGVGDGGDQSEFDALPVILGAAAPDMTSASNHAIRAAAKLAAKRPKTAAKLKAIGAKGLVKAKAAVTAAKLMQTAAKAPAIARPGVPSRTTVTAAARRVMQRQHLLGVDTADLTKTYDPNVGRILVEIAAEIEAVGVAGDIESSIIDLGNQLSPSDPLTVSGQAIVNRCDAVISNFDPDVGDPSVIWTVAGIQADANVWMQAAGGSGFAASPSSGAYSSPGGGGYDDDTGQSPALQAWRESGGAVDPFDDDQGTSADDSDAAFDDGGDDSGDDSDAQVDEVLGALLLDANGDIADEDADLERGRGSAHRGAAYLQAETYPPGGSSAAPVFGLDALRMRRAARRR